MISKTDLQKLSRYRLADAKALYQKKRYYATVYMSGYAVELALKYKICRKYNFSRGFPETKDELQSYNLMLSSNTSINRAINNITDIRHHDLNELMTFSGDETNIKQNYFPDWLIVFTWKPEMRYKVSMVRKKAAQDMLASVEIIINAVK